jgi:hypothetical protein
VGGWLVGEKANKNCAGKTKRKRFVHQESLKKNIRAAAFQ